MNEAQFVNRWVDSMSEADKIVALVHDCTDSTEELLKSKGVIVDNAHYDNWRFDVGKNDALNLARKKAPECNILCFTSLDEVWDPGWADIIRKEWNENINIAYYKFVQTHDVNGNDEMITSFDWMHSNDPSWYWKYPVDEKIVSDKLEKKYLNLFDKIKLNHWPDYSARERKYDNLRKLAFEEYRDAPSRIALSREYNVRGMWEELYDLLKDYDIEKDDKTNIFEKAYFYMYLANSFRFLKERFGEVKALDFYKKSIETSPDLRDPYINYGAYLCEIGCFEEAEAVLTQAVKVTSRIYSWQENPDSWTCDPYIWLTIACYNQEEYIKALGYAQVAKLAAPEKHITVNNLKFCEDKIKELLKVSNS